MRVGDERRRGRTPNRRTPPRSAPFDSKRRCGETGSSGVAREGFGRRFHGSGRETDTHRPRSRLARTPFSADSPRKPERGRTCLSWDRTTNLVVLKHVWSRGSSDRGTVAASLRRPVESMPERTRPGAGRRVRREFQIVPGTRPRCGSTSARRRGVRERLPPERGGRCRSGERGSDGHRRVRRRTFRGSRSPGERSAAPERPTVRGSNAGPGRGVVLPSRFVAPHAPSRAVRRRRRECLAPSGEASRGPVDGVAGGRSGSAAAGPGVGRRVPGPVAR
jgi:hypothetical protein